MHRCNVPGFKEAKCDCIGECGFYKMKKKPHGGKRKGAGAPKKEETKVIRVPVSKMEAIEKLLKRKNKVS